MMGRKKDVQPDLFYYGFNLDHRIRQDHILRKIAETVDFDFTYEEVRDAYGNNGNVSVPPPQILKMLLLLILYNVRSERELMLTIPERLDWLWFLGYDIDDEIPHHSVLSKARKRWGVDTFRHFFERIVWQCVAAGLVDGTKLFMDSSLIRADASNNSIVSREALKPHLVIGYRELESRLEDTQEESSDGDTTDDHPSGSVNRKHYSRTDPDASVIRQGKGAPKPQYKIHRGVDEKCEIITATEVTAGEVNEAHRLIPLLNLHRKNTEINAEIVVADTKYGTVDNYLSCHDLGVDAHIPDLKKSQEQGGLRRGIFSDHDFIYEPQTDIYRCPAGNILKRRSYHKKRDSVEYVCSRRTCAACHLRLSCTTSMTGRSIKRHARHDDLIWMREHAQSEVSLKDIRKRQHHMERSFAQGVRYGFKRARWRRLWRVQIQEYMTAAIQNVMIYLRHLKERGSAFAMELQLHSRWFSDSDENVFSFEVNMLPNRFLFFEGMTF